jgi:RHS repeat-associated protein
MQARTFRSRRSAHIVSHWTNLFHQLTSLLVVWALIMSSLPVYSADRHRAEWVDAPNVGGPPLSGIIPARSPAPAPGKLSLPRRTGPSKRRPGNFEIASTLAPNLPGNKVSDLLLNSLGINPFAVPLQAPSSPFQISVAFADNSSPSANFPTPWQGSPNITFIGNGTPIDSGALRIDNTSGSPLTIDSVAVDLQRGNAQFNLWGSFTIPADGSAILTQTQPGNFDTSAFPIVPCGGTLASGETRIPTITVTIAGTPQTFADTAHVLDTGGFDLSCRGNESLQWRPIGTSGIDHPTGLLTLQPGNATASGGSPIATTAQLTDAAGGPLPDVAVNFKILSGPNTGQSAQVITDSQGNALFTYAGSAQGADVLQASVVNVSNATVLSGQAVINWQTASCGGTASQTGSASLIYVGATAGEFNDSVELAALLTDSSGAPAGGRSLAFSLGGQNFVATTDATGVARVTTTLGAPGPVSVSVSFAGDATLPALDATTSINVDREETRIRYNGNTLIRTGTPQSVTALLVDPDNLAPIANEPVTFRVGTATVTAVTNASGLATAAITLASAQVGPSSMTISFAGDGFFKPSVQTVPLTIYSPAAFVLWGGNTGGLKIGQRVNFWGSQWESQVINGQYFAANPSFKGWSGSTAPALQCQVNATPSTITPACWQVKPGQSFPPSATLPDFIEAIVSTVIVKSGDTVYGNVACGAVIKVDHTPPYGAVPGQPGFGTIAGVNGGCSGVFPQPAVVTASQSQPASVLPNQQITVTATVTNSSTATAATNINLNETLDGLTPATVSLNLGTAGAGGSQSTSFQAVVPAIPARQGSETSTDYIQRLAALNGRIFTASGEVSFTDAAQQIYLPIDVSSQSVLKIPIITLALTGPAVVSPGASANYLVTATNIGSATASSVQLNVVLPDGSTKAISTAGLAPGSSFTQPVSFTPAAIAPKGANESTSDYLARLSAADGQLLTTDATVNWSDANGNAYGDVGQQMFSTKLRIPVLNFTGQAPATLLPSQDATLNFNVNNIGGCTAVQASLQVTNPDSTVGGAPQFPLAPGDSTTAQTTWHVTAVAARLPSETDAAYQARLAGINNTLLNFQASLGWSDPAGAAYGPTSGSVQSKEVVPIVTVALSAPSTAQAGSTIGYAVMLTNIGGATSPAASLKVVLPDGSTQTPAVGVLAPGATFQTTINFLIPATQPAGTISAQASVIWNDAISNAYGPLSASAQTAVTNPTQFNSLVLAPAIAGPDVTGTTQTLTATLKDSTGAVIPNATVQFTVTGANPTGATGTTNASGVATFTYSGTRNGNDTVQATSGTAVSNNATVSWVTPVQNISTSTIFARFFTSDGSGAFNTPATATPAFTQSFPTINFNPPAGTIPGNTSGIGVNTRPFFDVTTDLNGNFTGTIEAKGNGVEAGLGTLFTFQAVFTSTFTVASAGDVVLSFFSDDGFILGVGGGATRVSGPLLNVPASGHTAFENLPVIGAFNSATAPVANTIVVHFPAAGSYPYELDYTECCAGQEVLTMTVGQSNSKGVPPTGSLKLSPINPPTLAAGQTQTFTVQASDASGAAVPNAGVALIINGANMQQLSATTDATGRATFSYSAVNAGTDSLQAVANISGLGAFSNMVNVNWTVPAGGGGGTTSFAQQGWIGQPLIGTVTQGQLPITVASGITLTSGTLEYWPTSNPSDVHVINGNTTGSGTIGTFDGTALANGGYTIQLNATASNGSQLTSVIVVSVIGDNKPGRVIFSATDLKMPLAGLPITITRTYDSLKKGTSGDFGFGWTLATSVDLQVDAANNVSFTINGQRRTFFFQVQPSSFLFPWLLIPKYVPQVGLHGSLTSDGCGGLIQVQGNTVCFPTGPYQPTTYTYTDPIGRVFVIAANGQIQSIKDTNGNTLTFGPNGITSSAAGGLTVPFTRDTQGRITQITDLTGNAYIYNYDASGNLVTVSLPGTTTPATFTYSTDHLLTGETDPRGNSTSTAYFPDGRLQSITDSFGNTTHFSYNLTANSVTTTNPDGGVSVTTNNSFGKPLSFKDPLNRTTTYVYDANQNLTSTTDPLGHITKYTYDANGFQTSVTDPLQHTSSKVYDQFGDVTSRTDAAGNTTTINYDTAFNPVQESDSLGQLLSGAYDAAGNVVVLTNANGKTTHFTHDANGNLTQFTDSLNRVTTYTYDAMDRQISKTDPRQNTTRYGYDALGHLTSVTDANSNVKRFEYDDAGNKTAEVDALQRRTTYTYDVVNRLTKITYPDQTTRSYTYDFRGNKLTDTDQLGRVTKNVYDLAGQLSSVTYAFGTPDAATILYTYDLAGHKLTETDGRGNLTTYGYNAAGRITSLKNALGNISTFGYDTNNHLNSITDANQHTTSLTYDARRRLTSITYPDATTKKFTYDGMGNQLTATDRANHVTTKSYDDANRMVAIANALNQATQYSYDPANNLASVTDANQHVTSFQYDRVNRLTVRTLPLGMSETRSYDAVGNLLAKTAFNQKTTSFSYDALNRLLQKLPDASLNQPAVQFAYTPTGKRASMLDASGTTTYSYDNRDRLIRKATPQGTLTYTYDAANNVRTLASSNTNGASMTYTYDALNRIANVTDNRLLAQGAISATTTYNYGPAGGLSSYTYPNGVQTTSAYDSSNRLTQTSSSKAVSLSSFNYSLDPEGHRLSVSELGGRAINYAYDAAYRLGSESISGDSGGNNGSASYTYDAVGNRTQLSSSLALVSGGVFAYDANDRLTSDSYDANGNTLLSAGVSNAYDFENRLVQHGGVSIIYDGDGNRVAETMNGLTTRYLVDDLNPTGYPQVVDEVLSSAVTRTYAYGKKRISQNQIQGNAGVASFYGYDGHGSVRFLSNASGAVTDTYSYDAFGTRLTCTGSTLNDFQYSGEQSDGLLGLYYLRARYYNPITGRFMTIDPELGNVSDPDSLHRYLYSRNDPVNRIDPTGRQDLEEYLDFLEALQAEAQFPKAIGKCEAQLFTRINTALTDAINGIDLPEDVQNAGYEFVKCLYDELLSPQTQAKNVIEYFFGELFEGFDRLLYDILTEIWDDTH